MAKKLNVAMLDQVEDVITRFPKRHSQSIWRAKLTGKDAELNGAPARECGTSMCIAGWVAELDRGRWAFPVEQIYVNHLLIARQDEIKDGVTHGVHRGPKGEHVVAAFIRAQRVLGITEDEASHLFLYVNNRAGVKKYFQRLKTRYGMV